MRFGTAELLIILVVVLLLFGVNKLPQLGDALGKGIRSFKKATSDEDEPTPEAPERPALQSPTAAREARETPARSGNREKV